MGRWRPAFAGTTNRHFLRSCSEQARVDHRHHLPERTPMPLETRPLHPTLACEVVGLSLWDPLDPDTIAELRDLWSRSGVLVFRRQALSEIELARFCAHFGPLERTVRTDWAS